MKVLVVDDSQVVRRRLAALLRELDVVHAVVEARDAESALELVASELPDAVVLDVHLPGRSGLAILPILKTGPRAPLVIVLTNDAGGQHRDEAFGRGADYFFDKSKSFDRVLEVLTEHEADTRIVGERPTAERGDADGRAPKVPR